MLNGNYYIVFFHILNLFQVTVSLGILAEIRRKFSQPSTQITSGIPGPVSEGCNLCVWGSCTPGIKGIPDHEFADYTDAEALKKAVTGFSVDKKTILQILTTRSEKQRRQICRQFGEQKDLGLAKLLSQNLDLKYRFSELMVALATPLPEYYAIQFKRVFKMQKQKNDKAERDIGRNDVIVMLTTLSPCFIRKVSRTYNIMYGKAAKGEDKFIKHLEKSLIGFPKSDYIDVLKEMALGTRDENLNPSWLRAVRDAYNMKEAIETQSWPKKKAVFMEVFTKRSIPQLRETFAVYQTLRQGSQDFQSLEDDIDHHMESVKEIYKPMVKIVQDPFNYYAGTIKDFFKVYKHVVHHGFITFIRVSTDIDLGNIKQAYENTYHSTVLKDFISVEVARNEYYEAMMNVLQ